MEIEHMKGSNEEKDEGLDFGDDEEDDEFGEDDGDDLFGEEDDFEDDEF